MPKPGSKRKASQGTSNPPTSTRNETHAASENANKASGKAPEKTSTESILDDFVPDQLERRLYMSQLTCKFLTWFFWPENTRLSDISTIVLVFISVIRAYAKFSDTDEGTSRYFLPIELVIVASSSVNLLLGEVPLALPAGLRAQILDLLLTLSSFSVFYLIYEWIFTTCIWTARKHLLSSDEIRGLENICSPRRWLCSVFSPPDCVSYYREQHQQRPNTS
ncbi:hypothetical protein BT96DRAFT_973485, partial [Gymnopus androsaceus JB14]